MNGEGQIKRDAFFRKQPVGHKGTYINVLAIVVVTLFVTINFIRRSRPLSIIAGCLKSPRHSADGTSTLYITHAGTETHGIGSNDTAFGTFVGDNYAVRVAATGVEVECTKIDPCGAAALLIDDKIGGFALMPNGIVSIGNTPSQCRITDINGVVAGFGDVGDVAYIAELLLCGYCLARRSCHKGILVVNVSAQMVGKAVATGIFP